MAPSPETPASKHYTVIGYWDDSDTAIAVAVVSRTEEFHACANVSVGGAWARDIYATSPEEAELTATLQTQEEFDLRNDGDDSEEGDDASEEDDEDDDEETGKVFEFDHNGRTYDVDFGGETYALYDDDNKHIAFFDYYGDRENHLSIEEAAIKALEALNL